MKKPPLIWSLKGRVVERFAQESNCAHVRDHRCCGRVRESGLQRPFVHRAAGCRHFAARLLRLHLEHHHDADRGVPDLHLRWLVHQAEDHRGRDHGLFAIPLACSMAHHDQVHRAHPDRDRLHLIPRAVPRLHDHLAERKSGCNVATHAQSGQGKAKPWPLLYTDRHAVWLVEALICFTDNP